MFEVVAQLPSFEREPAWWRLALGWRPAPGVLAHQATRIAVVLDRKKGRNPANEVAQLLRDWVSEVLRPLARPISTPDCAPKLRAAPAEIAEEVFYDGELKLLWARTQSAMEELATDLTGPRAADKRRRVDELGALFRELCERRPDLTRRELLPRGRADCVEIDLPSECLTQESLMSLLAELARFSESKSKVRRVAIGQQAD